MKDLSPEAKRLFELACDQDEPDALAQGRVERALAVRIAADPGAAPVGTAPVGTPPTAAGAGPGAIAAKSVLVASVTSALVAAGWLTLRPPRPSAPPPVERHPTTVVHKAAAKAHLEAEPVPQKPAAELVPERALSTAAHRKTALRPVAPPQPAKSAVAVEPGVADQLRAETSALRAAQSALRDRKPQQALDLLDEQDARFRSGALQQERAAARVLALCQADLVEEARAHAARFEQLWPRSALLARVRSACWDR